MSDRIEELVECVLDEATHDEWDYNDDYTEVHTIPPSDLLKESLTELATIARERDAAVAVVEAARAHLEYCDGSGYPIPDALAAYDAKEGAK